MKQQRVYHTSNPYRGGTPAWTTTAYDPLGRVTQVTAPDGAVTSTSHSGNQSVVLDPAGVGRRTTADALGRIVQVEENHNLKDSQPTLTAIYSYDARGNLKI
jgi:uncharacterized protein RhaS with RHS repeats